MDRFSDFKSLQFRCVVEPDFYLYLLPWVTRGTAEKIHVKLYIVYVGQLLYLNHRNRSNKLHDQPTKLHCKIVMWTLNECYIQYPTLMSTSKHFNGSHVSEETWSTRSVVYFFFYFNRTRIFQVPRPSSGDQAWGYKGGV